MKIIKQFPPNEPIVSMIQYKDYILVATSWHVFRLREDDTFEPLEFLAPEELTKETPAVSASTSDDDDLMNYRMNKT